MCVRSLECVGRLGMSRRSLDLGTKPIRSNNNLICCTEMATGDLMVQDSGESNLTALACVSVILKARNMMYVELLKQKKKI